MTNKKYVKNFVSQLQNDWDKRYDQYKGKAREQLRQIKNMDTNSAFKKLRPNVKVDIDTYINHV